ncbi:MAG: hypothetical protein ACHQQS_16335 [Thermoanaerobaculales bacterium]
MGGSAGVKGGAGTVYLKGPSSTYGDLIVDNGGVDGQGTELPSLGSGVAQAGSGGAALVTDRAVVIPAYFVGHWVEVSTSAGTLKGTWRIASIAADGKTVTLVSDPAGQTIDVQAGDRWQGVYRFDSVTVKGHASAGSQDPIEAGTTTVAPGSSLYQPNSSAPRINASAIVIAAHDGAFWVGGGDGAVTDPDGIASAAVVNATTGAQKTIAVLANGSFAAVSIGGAGGQGVNLTATDANHWPLTTIAPVGTLPANAGPPQFAPDAQSRISFVAAGPSTWHLRGVVGTVGDPEPPIRLLATNQATSAQTSGFANGDGSFDLLVTAGPGVSFTLVATDGHPQPQSVMLTGLTTPSNPPPVIDVARISLTAHDGRFWATGTAGAVTDNDGIANAVFWNRTRGWNFGVVVAGDGSFGPVSVLGWSGDVFQLEVTESGPLGQITTATVGTLPVNAEAPTVDPQGWSLTREACGVLFLRGAPGAVSDPNGVASVLATNERTQETYHPLQPEAGGWEFYVSGAGTDSFSITATDGHPESRSATVRVATLPANRAPVVDDGKLKIVYGPPQPILAARTVRRGSTGWVFHVEAAEGAVTDPDVNRYKLSATGPSSKQWSSEDAFCSSDESKLYLPGAQTGDVIELHVTDDDELNPLTTSVTLPPVPVAGLDSSLVRLVPLGYGYQVVGDAGAVPQVDSGTHVVLSNPTTGWTGAEIPVAADGSFYARVEGHEGDEIQGMVVSGSQTSDPVSLGLLPTIGVDAEEVGLDGHTVSAISAGFILVDGGAALAALGEGLDLTYTGLLHARDVVFNPATGMPMALDGGNIVGWHQDSGGALQPVPLSVSSGALVKAQRLGDDLYLVAEETTGIGVIRLAMPRWEEASGAWVPECGAAAQSLTLPHSTGLHALALLPAPSGDAAVLTDDPAGELRLFNIADPAELAGGATVDLPGSVAPAWGSWQDGELLLGRSDGSVEVYQWSDSSMARLTSWAPSQGAVKAAVRTGNQLWVGLDNGLLQQVDLADPSQPHSLGQTALDSGVVAMGPHDGALLVATAVQLYLVSVSDMPPAFTPTLVSWNHGASGSWINVGGMNGSLWRIASWGTMTDTAYCSGSYFETPDDIGQAPVLEITSDGIHGTPFVPSAAPLRDFDHGSGPALVISGSDARPAAGCATNRGTGSQFWSSALNDTLIWAATAVNGQPGVDYVYETGRSGAGGRVELTTDGPVAQVFAEGTSLLVADGGLQEWNLDDTNGGSATAPVLARQIELFGQDSVAVAVRTYLNSNDTLVFAANNPPRFALVTLDSSRDVVADNVALSLVEGQILDVTAFEVTSGVTTNQRLALLTNGGASGRLYTFDISQPASPQLLAQRDLPGGAPATAFDWGYDGDGAAYLVVVRRGWGIEVYGGDLTPVTSLAIPGDAQDVAWNWVALGEAGVGVLTGLPANPTVTFVPANATETGTVVRVKGAVLGPPGMVSFDDYLWDQCQTDGGGSNAAATVVSTPRPRRPAGATALRTPRQLLRQ